MNKFLRLVIAGLVAIGAGSASAQTPTYQSPSYKNVTVRANLGWIYTNVNPGGAVTQTTGNTPLFSSLGFTGAAGNSSTSRWAANSFNLVNDDLTYAGQNYVSTLSVSHGFGGPNTRGARAGLDVNLYMGVKTGNTTNASRQYTAIATLGTAGANDGGTAMTSTGVAGAMFGANPLCIMNPAATFWYSCVGQETDVSVAAGASVAYKIGMSIVQINGDAVAGGLLDAGLTFANQSNAKVGWTNGISFGVPDALWPFNSGSTLINVTPQIYPNGYVQPVAMNGVDFRNVNFSGTAFASNGFVVDGAGNVSVASLNTNGAILSTGGVVSLTRTSGGVYDTIPAITIAPPPTGATATASVGSMTLAQIIGITSGGAGYVVGDLLPVQGGTASTPSVLRVTAIGTGGAVTAAAIQTVGTYTVLPPVVTTVTDQTTPTATGATFHLGYYVSLITLTNSGTGYTIAPSVKFALSPYGTATAFAVTNSNVTLAAGGASLALSNGTVGINGGMSVVGGSLAVTQLAGVGTVMSITKGTSGTYTFLPTITIAPPPQGVAATAVPTMALANVISIGSGGTGYTVGDTLTIMGVTGTPGQLRVAAVDVNGAVTSLTALVAGSMTTLPTQPAALSGGTGTGATATLGFYILSIAITNGGYGYLTTPSVTISTSPYGSATATTTLSQTLTVASPIFTGAQADKSYSYQAILSGGSYLIPNGVSTLLLDPAASISSGMITLPVSPVDGQMLTIKCGQTITTLSLIANTGQTIRPGSVAANTVTTTCGPGLSVGLRYTSNGLLWFY